LFIVQKNKIIYMSIKSYVCIVLIFIFGFSACKLKPSKEYVEIKANIIQNPEDIVFGNDNSVHTIFLYASYNCKYCRYLFSRTFPNLKKKYLNKGIVKVVVKFVELSENSNSLYALNVASCIYRFGKYEKFHDLLLANPSVVLTEDFHLLVDDIMSDNIQIAQCVAEGDGYEYLKQNVREFRKLKFTGTPTIVINNHVYSGYISFKKLDKILKKEFNF